MVRQDIPKTADHAPSRTIYTFRAVPADAYHTLLLNVMQALLNVRVRLAHELAKEQEVRSLPPLARLALSLYHY